MTGAAASDSSPEVQVCTSKHTSEPADLYTTDISIGYVTYLDCCRCISLLGAEAVVTREQLNAEAVDRTLRDKDEAVVPASASNM